MTAAHRYRALSGYNGELLESVTGHYLLGMGYRAYSPVLRIFTQPDSWSPFGAGGLNAYAYCEGDPVNAADPTGHLPIFGAIRFRHRFRPLPDPYASPPGSPYTAGREASRLLGEFLEPPPVVAATAAVVPGTSAGTSPARLRLAAASPSGSTSSSVVAASAGSAGALQVTPPPRRANLVDAEIRNERIRTQLPALIEARDAQGIRALANEHRSRIPVMKALFRELPLSVSVRADALASQGNNPVIRQTHLHSLRREALLRNRLDDEEFYRALRVVLDERRL
uniref:RHS repeat-associated core domain-containing protein n=1 Tax=Pseudomonas ulcerans TaxID=3115852 RepID=UPI0035CD242A